MQNLVSSIESILFVSGEPVSSEKLKKICNASEEDVENALEKLRADYENRGIALIQKENKWQLATAPANAHIIEQMVKSEFTEELSRAGLETLTIVAYRGPLTRAAVEYIRGVNSVFTLRNLLMRGLIERVENPKDARSYLYSVSFDFMKTLGITRLQDLPRYEELQKKAEELTASFEALEEKTAPDANHEPHGTS
ncbi:SMC-Scp complex subunit ScpB, partial [Patescibacteria group bacterium]|nr:SMC-Scp complex subunit ScpB [Patescibacteria group bacterium]